MSDERRDTQGEPWRDRFEDLKEAYALGALTEDERREFEGYLVAHPGLQAEVDELESIANLLALAPQEYEPPPELRRNLLSRIGSTASATLTGGPPRRARFWALFGPGRLAAVSVAAAAVIAVGLFVWNLFLQEENQDLRGELQSRQTHELQASGEAEGARGEVVEIGDGHAVLMAENLPSVPKGKVYKTWLLRNDVPEPAGTFEPHDGVAAAPIEGSMEGVDAVAVTMEQDDDYPMPRSKPLLTADL